MSAYDIVYTKYSEMAPAAAALGKKKGWFRKKNLETGQSQFRDWFKYSALGGILGWFMLDPNAGSRIGGLFGNVAKNTTDAAGGLFSPFMNPSFISLASSLVVVLLIVFVPILMKKI